MMDLLRRWDCTRSILRAAQIVMAGVLLALSPAGWADVPAPAGGATDADAVAPPSSDVMATPPAPDVTVVPPARSAGLPGAARKPPVRRLTVAQRIDENVRRLTRGLSLDVAQQQTLRQILADQHQQIMALRNGNAGAPGDVAGSAMAVYDQTRARIRAMLTEEQQQKYSVDVPRSELAPAKADLQHWIDLQESGQRRAQSEDRPSEMP
jgi:hypothetical protein